MDFFVNCYQKDSSRFFIVTFWIRVYGFMIIWKLKKIQKRSPEARTGPNSSPAPVPRERRKGKANQTGGVDFHKIDKIFQFELQSPERVQRYLINWRNGDSTPTWENAGGICSVAICAFWNRVFAEKAQYEQRRAPRARARPTKKMQANIGSAAYWEELKNERVLLELGVDANIHLPNFIDDNGMNRENGMWKGPFEADEEEKNGID